MLTKEDVVKIATLAKLDISGQEDLFASLFSQTIDYIKVLEELDTKNIAETYQVTGLVNIFQQGEKNRATLTKEEVLQNAHEVVNGLIATKGVFDRD
jgi:aspartyl/glutamyl-tRNA(Asn/Gln) amidotransferase C subunit